MGGVYIENLSEHVVRNTTGIMSLLREGSRLRTTGSTRMNKVRLLENTEWYTGRTRMTKVKLLENTEWYNGLLDLKLYIGK